MHDKPQSKQTLYRTNKQRLPSYLMIQSILKSLLTL
jgi:hypothetical protein